MSFTSLSFIGFLAAVFVVYYIVPRRIQWVVLLVASLLFYLSAGVKIVFFLFFSTATTFLAGLLLGRLRAEQKLRKEGLSGKEKIQVNALFDQQKRLVVAVALVLNLDCSLF